LIKLKKYYKSIGFSELKDKQINVNKLLLGNDVVGLLSTGYTKSMCYLIPLLDTKSNINYFTIIFFISKMNIYLSALHSNNKGKYKKIFKILCYYNTWIFSSRQSFIV